MSIQAPCELGLVLNLASSRDDDTESLCRAIEGGLARRAILLRGLTSEMPATPEFAVAIVPVECVWEPATQLALNRIAKAVPVRIAHLLTQDAVTSVTQARSYLMRAGWVLTPEAAALCTSDGAARAIPASLADIVVPTAWYAVMRSLRDAYWAEATREPARVPTRSSVRGPDATQVELILDVGPGAATVT